MKILLRIYLNSFYGNCKTDSVEIPSNNILVNQLKTIIFKKLNIPENEQRLTIKIGSKLVTLTDDFPLSFFFIRKKNAVHLERIALVNKAEQIKNKLLNSKNPKLKQLANLTYYNHPRSLSKGKNHNANKQFLMPIVESVVEYSEEPIENERKVIDKAIDLIKDNDNLHLEDILLHLEIKNINTIGEKGYNLLQYSCYHGYSNIVEVLINKYHADVNLLTEKGQSPLYLAVKKQQEKCVAMLIGNKNINPDIVIKNGIGTALHLACKISHWRIISLLLHKANPK